MKTTWSWQIGPEPPEWIRILPLGEVKLGDGRKPFRVTEASLAGIVEAWRQRGNDMVIDYEHQTVRGQEAPAAGWVKEMVIKPDGLWGRVEWTARAEEYLARKEYRYFSPVVELDDERVVRDLLHVALTNVPAMANLTPLVLAADREKNGLEAEKFGGLPGDAAEWQELKDLLLAELQAAAGPEAGPEQLRQQWRQWQEAAAELEKLRVEVANLRRWQRQEQARQLIQEALRSGRTTPAELEQGGGRLKRLAEEDPEFFRELILSRAPQTAIPGPLPLRAEATKGCLTPVEAEICRQLRIGAEEFLALKETLEQGNRGELQTIKE